MLIPIPKGVGIILLVLVGGALLFWFIKSLKGAGWEGEDLDLQVDDISTAARNLQALPDARSNVLVKLADRALRRGDPKEAAILLHLAVLRYLDDEGLARYHPSKTNGDYIRAIRRLKPLRDLLRGVANETERVRFGDGRVDERAIEALIEGGKAVLLRRGPVEDPFEGVGPAATALLFALALAPGLTACTGDDESLGSDLPAYHTHGPIGMSALPAILRGADLDVDIGYGRFADVEPGVGVVVVRTSAASKGWEILRLDDLLDRNINVVVIDDLGLSPFFLPTTEHFTPAHEIRAVSLEVARAHADSFCSWKLAPLRTAVEQGVAPVLPRGRRIVWDGLATTATVSRYEMRLHPAIHYAGEPELPGLGAAAVAYAADRVDQEATLSGCTYVFSDRDLFTNASLTRASNARFVAELFKAITPDGQRIHVIDRFDEWSAAPVGDGGGAGGGGGGGGGSDGPPSPAKTLTASNMMAFVIQGLLTLILLFVFLGAAFGPLRDPAEREHKAFVEHVEAIGRQYARTGQAGLTHAAQSLAKLLVMRHRDRVRGGPSGGWGALAKHLAEKHGVSEADVQAVLRLGIDGVSELGTPRIDDPNPSSERMLRALSRLLDVRSKDVTEKPKRRGFRFRRRSG